MHTSIGLRSRCPRRTGVAALVLLASIATSTAHAIVPSGGDARSLVVRVQSVCRVGDYVTHDHALSVRNEMLRRGYHAWIEHHGSLYAGTRTYVVFVRC